MDFIKTLWYAYKVKSYEKLIIVATKRREAIKARQAKYTASQEKYRELLKKSTGVKDV
jgi:hypothetical protein